jgi:putative toxin-antitoxin system antitoxin component (TIGR02293 family)
MPERLDMPIPVGDEKQARIFDMLQRIEEKLGLKKSLRTDTDLVVAVQKGLSVHAISCLVAHGLYDKEVYSLIVPRRTLQHRRARKEKLSVEESDRAARVARLTTLAEKVFADSESGMRWLRAPKRRFAGKTPMEMLATEVGSHLIEEMLYQIDEGMAA